MTMGTEHQTQADETADANAHSLQAHWRNVVGRLMQTAWLQQPIARALLSICAGLLFALVVSVPLELADQMLFSAGTFGLAMLLRNTPGKLTTLVMIVLSVTGLAGVMLLSLVV